MNEFEKRKRAWDRVGEEVRQLKAENEQLRATCENAANVVENVLDNLQRDLWRIPEPTRITAVSFLRAVVEECRGIARHDSTQNHPPR